MEKKKVIYLVSGKVSVQVKPPTKTLEAYWMPKKFKNAIVSGVDKEDAMKQLTAMRIFSNKDDSFYRDKEIQIIEVNFKILA